MRLTLALLLTTLLVCGCANAPTKGTTPSPAATTTTADDHSGHNHGPGEGHSHSTPETNKTPTPVKTPEAATTPVAAQTPAPAKNPGKEAKGGEQAGHEGHEPKPPAAATAPGMAQVPPGARVNFGTPVDGVVVGSPVKVRFEIQGMEVKPAGDMTENSGHHHLIVDGQSVRFGDVIPADPTHFHFGKGQTETEIELEPGKHTLTLQFGDFAHRSYGERMSSTVTIMVE